MSVYLIGTLDTKAREIAWVREALKAGGVSAVVVDAGCQGEAGLQAGIAREQVFEAAGTTLQHVREAGDRGQAVALAATGVQRLISDQFASAGVRTMS